MQSIFFITGASKGIGKGLAKRALKEGATVVGISRSHSITHEKYVGIELDLSDLAALIHRSAQLFQDIAAYERVVLINNAGTLGEVEHLGKLSPLSIRQLMDLNVSAPMILMNAFIQQLKAFKGEKVIFNVSSGAGKRAVDGWAGYCASKAALDMATKVVFEENILEKNHFQVRAIAPGVVDTAMQTQIRESSEKAFSGVDKFINLKKNRELSSEDTVAEKFFTILNNLATYSDPILDVRNISAS